VTWLSTEIELQGQTKFFLSFPNSKGVLEPAQPLYRAYRRKCQRGRESWLHTSSPTEIRNVWSYALKSTVWCLATSLSITSREKLHYLQFELYHIYALCCEIKTHVACSLKRSPLESVPLITLSYYYMDAYFSLDCKWSVVTPTLVEEILIVILKFFICTKTYNFWITNIIWPPYRILIITKITCLFELFSLSFCPYGMMKHY
jgi:hypothetical protein